MSTINVLEPICLIIDNEPLIHKDIAFMLKSCGFRTESVYTYADAVSIVAKKNFDAFVVDLNLGDGGSGVDFLRAVLAEHPKAPFLIVTGHLDHGDIWTAKLFDFWVLRGGPLCRQTPKLVTERVLREWAGSVLEYLRNRQSALASEGYHALDARMKHLVTDVIPMLSKSMSPVLILGETGTGKEGFAEQIHRHKDNDTKNGPFRALNCAAVSDELLLSELFGHVKNSFTGAVTHRAGLFGEASGWNLIKQSASDQRDSVTQELLDYLGIKTTDDLAREVFNSESFNAKRAKIDDFISQLNTLNKKLSQSNESYVDWLRNNGNNVVYLRGRDRDSRATKVTIMGRDYEEVRKREDCEYISVTDVEPGTLFLDEIGDLSPSAEVALLRALDGYGIRPIGYTGPPLLPNCRIIAATNRIRNRDDLRDSSSQLRREGIMRNDLFYRLSGWVVTLPPLRDRRMTDNTFEWVAAVIRWANRDGLLVIDEELAQFADELQAKSRGELWHGNWRELKQVYERAKVYTEVHLGKKQIGRKALDFAIEWVLVDSSSGARSQESVTQDNSTNKERWTLDDCVNRIVKNTSDKDYAVLKLLFTATKENRKLDDAEFLKLGYPNMAGVRTVVSKLRKRFKEHSGSGWMIPSGQYCLLPTSR